MVISWDCYSKVPNADYFTLSIILQVTSVVMPLDYLEDEYDTRDCAALKVSFKVFNNVCYYLEVLGKNTFSSCILNLGLDVFLVQ